MHPKYIPEIYTDIFHITHGNYKKKGKNYIVLFKGKSLNLVSSHILNTQGIISSFNKMTQISHA